MVIAILIALLMPGLQRARNTAQSAACQAKLKSMGGAMTMYRLDFDSWVPPSRHGLHECLPKTSVSFLDLTLFRLESDKKPRLFLKNEQCVDKHLPHQREMFIDTLRGR